MGDVAADATARDLEGRLLEAEVRKNAPHGGAHVPHVTLCAQGPQGPCTKKTVYVIKA